MNIILQRRLMYGGGGNKLPTFAGLNIAPAPLYYNGSSFVIKDDDWNHDSYNSIYGLIAGSYYFNWNDCHSISNISYGDYNDWRMPTKDEWYAVTTKGSRTGSTINGTSRCLFTLIQLTGVTHAGKSSPIIGLLLAPDGKIMMGMSRTLAWNYDSSYRNTGVTSTELNEYLDAGCVFLPASGYRDVSNWYGGGTDGRYWSSNEYSSSDGYLLYFYSTYFTPSTATNKARSCSCRLVRTA